MNIETSLTASPKVTYIPDYDPKGSTGWAGIKALWYEGAEYQGKPTKVFAYIGYPKRNAGEKVPAVVLVHGGGGHAYAHWIKLWNERGYAAIAMDTEGYFPAQEWKGLTGTEGEDASMYTRELYGRLAEDNYHTGPCNDNMLPGDNPLEEQWAYHAVIDTILAHNILREDPNIDAEKIGITGISWGSVIASIAIGYDTRYAFAIPIYGSGYLEYADTYVCRGFKDENVRRLWSAADRLKECKFPVLWMCGLKDVHFCSLSNSLSYLATKDHGSYISIQEELKHSHAAAWNGPESYRFADCVLNNRVPFVAAKNLEMNENEILLTVDTPGDMVSVTVKMLYITEAFAFSKGSIKTEPLNQFTEAQTSFDGTKVVAEIPENMHCCYFEFSGYVGKIKYTSSTPWIYTK